MTLLVNGTSPWGPSTSMGEESQANMLGAALGGTPQPLEPLLQSLVHLLTVPPLLRDWLMLQKRLLLTKWRIRQKRVWGTPCMCP